MVITISFRSRISCRMLLYFSIVETMSYSDKVANFLEAPTDELSSVNMDDLELIAGDVMERVRSQPNSPFGN